MKFRTWCSWSSYTLIDSSSLRMKGARVIQVSRFVYLSKVMLNISYEWEEKKIKPHVNGNEYADSCRFNPRSQIYSSHICQLIRFSLLFGGKKQSPWDKFCFRLSLQIHHYGQPYFEVCTIEFDERKWIRGKNWKPVSVKVVITLYLRLHIRSIDSHTIVVFCMYYACRWMCEFGIKELTQ